MSATVSPDSMRGGHRLTTQVKPRKGPGGLCADGAAKHRIRGDDLPVVLVEVHRRGDREGLGELFRRHDGAGEFGA
jgi:hypothetical protein